MCLLKCEILKSLGDSANCEKWSHVHSEIIFDIQMHLRALETIHVSVENENMSQNKANRGYALLLSHLFFRSQKVVLHEVIASTIRLSTYDPQNRFLLFQWLLVALLSSNSCVTS